MLVRNWLSKLTTCLSPRARTRRRTSRSRAAAISGIQRLESRVLLAATLAGEGSITFTENDAATAIADAITVTDGGFATQASAEITITNFVAGQDVLAFTNVGLTMGNIAETSNVDGVLMLTSDGSSATNEEWQTALRAVTYENTSEDPDTTQREVDYVVNDGTDDSNILTSTIDITAENDAPVLAGPGSITYTENDPATAIAAAITVADVDSATQASATIMIVNFVAGEDVLGFTNDNVVTMGNIAVTSNVVGVLTLTSDGATATNEQWQTALRAVTYENISDDPDTTQRFVDFVVNDGATDSNAVSSTIDITAENDAPVLADIETDPLLYAPHAGATEITSTLSLVDMDSADITGATVQITDGYHPLGDVLGFTDTVNITGVYNAMTGTLTLTGTDTAANYQAALRSVTYVSSSPDAAARTVSFQVTDAEDLSNIETREIGGYAQLNGNTVNVYGTQQGDTIIVTDDGPLAFVVNGVSTEFVSGSVTAINIFGYGGDDLIQIDSLTSGKLVQAFGGAGKDTLHVDSGVTSGVILNGGAGDDELIGGSGNDVLIGGLGIDWLDGGDGSDRLEGGAGNDVYAFTVATGNQIDTVVELAGEGTDTLNFEDMTTSVTVNLTSDNLTATMAQRIVRVGLAGQSANIENVFGGSANDQITGNAANNYLDGGAGNDLLKGGIGDDVLIGGAGSDYLIGEAGNDSLDGGDGYNTLVGGLGDDRYVFNPATVNQIDTIVELVGEGIDTLDFSELLTAVTVNLASDSLTATMARRIVRVGSAGQSANFENATGGSANDNITGNAASNLLIGNAGNDILNGGTGNDILLGGVGNDVLRGFSGRNLLIGGIGGDLLQGGTDGDLLLSGSSMFEADPVILQALLAEWASGNTYQDRVDHLLGNTAGGANDPSTLDPMTVTNDANVDYLTGNAGQDWFLASSLQDVLTDKAVDEVFTDIDAWI